jgi:hypothetical protein
MNRHRQPMQNSQDSCKDARQDPTATRTWDEDWTRRTLATAKAFRTRRGPHFSLRDGSLLCPRRSSSSAPHHQQAARLYSHPQSYPSCSCSCARVHDNGIVSQASGKPLAEAESSIFSTALIPFLPPQTPNL